MKFAEFYSHVWMYFRAVDLNPANGTLPSRMVARSNKRGSRCPGIPYPPSMKTIIKAIWCILVLAVAASAANYTVQSGGGGNYTTIQACANAMSAGDTCTVYAGTYNENVTVSAGTAGNYKTLTVNSGDTVYVQSFSINSHVKINGFQIQNPPSPNTKACVAPAANSTDYFVTNNVMYACAGGIIEVGTNSNTTHSFIQGNTISYMCSTSAAPNVCRAMSVNGDYHLIEHNDISHVSGTFVLGAHNVLRHNSVHDINYKDCGTNSSNCHIDFAQADSTFGLGGSRPSQYLLVESNSITNSVGPNMKAGVLLQAEDCNSQCFNAIIRFHTASHVGTGAIVDDNSQVTSTTGWYNVKSYNNSWIDVNNYPGNTCNGCATDSFANNSTNGSDINNIFYYTESLTNFNPYYSDASSAPFSYGHNLAWCTTGSSNCDIHGHVYGNGNFTDDSGNLKTDPLLVNYAGNNFQLSSSSPAIGAGTYLTRASGSGSNSTSLTVADAGFFQDGFGIPGVQADWIRIGATTTVQISSVNYSANALTLTDAVSWNNGDPIYIYKISDGTTVLAGNNPDLGAFPSTSSVTSKPASPTGLTALVH